MFWITSLFPRKTAYTTTKTLFLCLLIRGCGDIFKVIKDIKEYLRLQSSPPENDYLLRQDSSYFKSAKKALIRFSILRKISLFYGISFLLIRVTPGVI
eukprot:snap_masked-scaffold_8-processed-gene-14.22-mRNA-1 protein AED:0.41 eAED:1.00 QI:0/0/0/1/1/1/3/0/97